MSELSLKAIKREGSKGSDLTALRTNGMIPGVFYGTGVDNIPVAAKDLDLRNFIYTSESHLINLSIDGDSKKYTCILKDVQFDPIRYKPIHFDLMAIKSDVKIKVEVPINLVGNPIGVKEGGVLQHALHKIEVECLPKDIPSAMDVNVEELNIGDSIKVEDLKTDDTFIILNEPTANIASVTAPLAEEESTTETDESQEPEVIGKGKETDEAAEENS